MFPGAYPEEPVSHIWIAALVAALLFFGSVLAHELSHSLVAKALGLRVLGITLFIFGGVSRLATDPEDPWTEIKVALAGPLMSFALGAFFLFFWFLALGPASISPLVPEVLEYLAAANLVLGLFNLVPGFPLDGGRVLRGLWWLATGSFSRATRVAARVGSIVAFGIMGLGGALILSGGLGGLWLILIGLFLWTAAGASARDGAMRELLDGVRVDQIMVRELVTIPAESTVQDAVDGFFLVRGHSGFPVTREGEICGLITLADVDPIPARRRPWVLVCDVMAPREELESVAPGDPARAAVDSLARDRKDRLLVEDEGRVVGMVTDGDVRRFLRTRRLRDDAAR